MKRKDLRQKSKPGKVGVGGCCEGAARAPQTSGAGNTQCRQGPDYGGRAAS